MNPDTLESAANGVKLGIILAAWCLVAYKAWQLFGPIPKNKFR